MSFVVAIDGPAGTGKGTVTKIVAKKTGLINIDTGAMYRCVALVALNNGILPNEEEKIAQFLKNIDIKLIHNGENQEVILNGKNVSNEIRKPEVEKIVAKFAALKVVRDKITPLQRKMGEENDVIMEGRDIGTVVFPNADIKIYLDCEINERAKRRYKQNLKKGINQSFEEVLKEITLRHKLETEREIAPFIKAKDAITIDSTNMTIMEVVEKIEELIRRKRNG